MIRAKTMTVTQIITSYEAGESLSQISSVSGYTVEGVRQALKRNGVEMRPVGQHSTRDRASTFADELFADIPTFREPVTLNVLTDWFGAEPEKVATTVKRLFLLGKLTVQVAP